ncbi:chitinase 3 precursor, putative [Talaromyces stipitatus ATCC 10500]|uniref:Chitinase 3, putative n=1 Tax=Talaromyces stipitatus (strain ATCC 10500 / CBS 375.48 / QM 6759 / NRRL 1006) TaxID=441959 RepID=B8MG47_TALSN|nr:chitinase 3 precursor, putative [Talaromyces stipitatus ATCC 10500]EED15914.1 chitinase 3 precursor, putative [Talaromyces stipitatus ATCC 10500]
MNSFRVLSSLGLLASSVLAGPISIPKRQTSTGQNVVYWGQNGGGIIENPDLAAYCTGSEGIDIIVLAFLYQFGNGVTVPGGSFGQTCSVLATSGTSQSCDAVASAITTCQNKGINVFLSLGGGAGGYSLTSVSEAESIGQYLWDAYGNPSSTSVSRPFGNAVVNGWDFDIENASGSQYYPYLISKLRSNFASDKNNKYYISGAPQCPIPEPNMGTMIQDSEFDMLFIQFYNNNNYTHPCALGINGDAAFNYAQWDSFISTSNSSSAELFIGVPAAPLAANGADTGSIYYATPNQLATIVSATEGNSSFGGVMLWSAGFSDSNVNNGCTYAQEVETILKDGEVCSGSYSVTQTLTPVAPTPSFSGTATGTSTATPTGTPVPEWGQCGGQGYTGSTVCDSGLKCVAEGAYWSSCQPA